MKKLRLAVVGAGRLGGFHARKLAALDDVELLAVVDPLPEARGRLAAECNTRPLADYGELLDKLDAAVIAVPTRLHHKLALDFLGCGIHLLVEKPLASTLAEADELVQAARLRGTVLQVGHIERFNPAFAAAVLHTAEPKYIEAVRASGFTFRSTDVGVVLDLMIHDLDLVLSMVRSPVQRVDALGLSVMGSHEDVANARLEFECGCVATLSASRVSYQPARRMHLWSSSAFAAIDFADRTTTLVRPSQTLLNRQLNIDLLSPQQVEHYKEHLFEELLPRADVEFEPVDALALELEDFLESIRTPRRPRVPGEAGRDAVAVAEQILGRIHAHAWDDTPEGPVGPLLTPRHKVIPAPHFDLTAAELPQVRREAG
ncbi:MAG: Gfo/Idh/MocA family protein [Planctomycetota bacterium]